MCVRTYITTEILEPPPKGRDINLSKFPGWSPAEALLRLKNNKANSNL